MRRYRDRMKLTAGGEGELQRVREVANNRFSARHKTQATVLNGRYDDGMTGYTNKHHHAKRASSRQGNSPSRLLLDPDIVKFDFPLRRVDTARAAPKTNPELLRTREKVGAVGPGIQPFVERRIMFHRRTEPEA